MPSDQPAAQSTRCICREAGYTPCFRCTLSPQERDELSRLTREWLEKEERRGR